MSHRPSNGRLPIERRDDFPLRIGGSRTSNLNKVVVEKTCHLFGIPSRIRLQQQFFKPLEMLLNCVGGVQVRSNY